MSDGEMPQIDCKAPLASVRPRITSIHGSEITDNYFWLRQRSDPEVIEYIEAENAYANALLEHTEKWQEEIYREILARMKEADVSVPVKRDEYYYYHRTEEGQPHSIYCRKRGSLSAAEEILLDANILARGQGYFRVGAAKVSPDHRLLAYCVDTSGAETYTLSVKNLETDELLTEGIPDAFYFFEWANDNANLFYSSLDENKRPYRLYRHIVGGETSADQLIYQEDDEQFFLSLSKTKSRRYLNRTSRNQTGS